MKKPVNSGAKGSSFERATCKHLSMWLSKGRRDDLFWRSAMSGGRATIGIRDGGFERSAQAGDITAITQAGERFLSLFVVECKHYADLQLHNLVAKRSGNTQKFWAKHVKECKKFKKHPMLIAKQNLLPVLFVTSLDGLRTLHRSFRVSRRMSVITVPMDDEFMYIGDFNAMTEYVDGT